MDLLVGRARVRNVRTKEFEDVHTLLDIGADQSFIASNCAEPLGTREDGSIAINNPPVWEQLSDRAIVRNDPGRNRGPSRSSTQLRTGEGLLHNKRRQRTELHHRTKVNC
ncbi:hypothetical protein GCK32_010755 [Trichostrongylus colubriformis]|uniref:Peptidase A2 domain-containing protein n=1 Tax=Trichostrongylus colubriformis TaxID=6319 RepID=A0AAN8IQ85_TRICO